MHRHHTFATIGSLGLALCLCCSRSNGAPADPTAAKKTSAPNSVADATSEREAVALLVLDEKGAAKRICLATGKRDDVFPGAKFAKILDVSSSSQGLALAAVVAANGEASKGASAVLAVPGKEPRPLGDHVRWAGFSPQGDALLVESDTRQHVGGGVMAALSTSSMVETLTGKTENLGGLTDPRWEADGQHARATRLQKVLRDRKTHVTAQWLATRVRWDRASKTVTELGPGSSQLPAPRGHAVVWSGEPLRSALNDRCTLSLEDGGKVQSLPAAGRVCQGFADLRGTRWSSDGRWLAFTRPSGGDPGPADVQSLVLEVVSSAGQRHPSLAGMLAAATSHQAATPTATEVDAFPWLDWSSSNGRLVVQDPSGMVTLYDLALTKSFPLGVWLAPQLSPRGEYVLVRAYDSSAKDEIPSAAFVVHSKPGEPRIPLGNVRDARWIDASACSDGRATR